METEEEQQTYESVASDRNIDADAFAVYCKFNGISEDECDGYVISFEDAYVGDYDSLAHFAEQYYEMHAYDALKSMPIELVRAIDWEEVWESTLRHDFYEEDGYYFRNT